MRVLFLTQYFPPEVGAPQTRLLAVATELQRLGHEVEIITAMPSYPGDHIFDGYRGRWCVREEIGGVAVTRTWVVAAQGRGLRRAVSYLSFTATSTVGLVRARRPDWLFIESPPLFLAVPGLLYARFRRTRTVLNVADLWPDAAFDVGAISEAGMFARAARWLERWAYRRSTLVTAVTQGIHDALLQRGVPPERIRFLPNGVDLELFRPDRGDPQVLESLGLPPAKLFVYTGNIGLSQGLASVIEAMGIVAEADPEVVLALLGDGSQRPELEQMVEKHRLSNVLFLDPVPLETIADILPMCTGAVVSLADLPTNAGARPSKMFPAMGAGCPIVFAGLTEGASIVKDHDAGLTTPNGDPRAIADAILRLVAHPQEGARMGANGRALVESSFGWRALVAGWASSLEPR